MCPPWPSQLSSRDLLTHTVSRGELVTPGVSRGGHKHGHKH